jgi:signal peptidase II
MNVKKILVFTAIAFILFIGDALLKSYIHSEIPSIMTASPFYPYGGIGIFRGWHGIDFSIVHVINRGAAWGVFSSLQEYLFYARMAIIGGLLSYLFFVPASVYRKFCLMLIATGAIGNVADYFIYGHVVDMFYFIFWGYSYPVFNLADSFIFMGIVLLLKEALVGKRAQGKKQVRKSA